MSRVPTRYKYSFQVVVRDRCVWIRQGRGGIGDPMLLLLAVCSLFMSKKAHMHAYIHAQTHTYPKRRTVYFQVFLERYLV